METNKAMGTNTTAAIGKFLSKLLDLLTPETVDSTRKKRKLLMLWYCSVSTSELRNGYTAHPLLLIEVATFSIIMIYLFDKISLYRSTENISF